MTDPAGSNAAPGDAQAAGVMSANRAFYSAFADGDFAAMAAVWSEREDIACAHPGWPRLTGRTAVLESWRGILERPPSIVAATPRVMMLADGAAAVLCREIVSDTILTAVNLYRLEGDGGWRLTYHQAGLTNETLDAVPTSPSLQ